MSGQRDWSGWIAVVTVLGLILLWWGTDAWCDEVCQQQRDDQERDEAEAGRYR